MHSPCSLSPWLAAAHGGSSNHRYKTASNEHPPSTIVQQSRVTNSQIMREVKHLAATMNGESMGSPQWTSISEDGSTGGLSSWQSTLCTG